VANVNLKLSPAATRPESQTPVSETMSWVVESVFAQMTAVPCATVDGFGTNPPVPNVRAFVGIAIVAVEPDGAGDGEGAGDGVGDGLEGEGVDEYPPQPLTNAMRRRHVDTRRIGVAVMNPPNVRGALIRRSNGTATSWSPQRLIFAAIARRYVSQFERYCGRRKRLSDSPVRSDGRGVIAVHRMTPRRTAYKTISAALCTSSFSRMRARCVSTVLGLMKSSAAMSLFVFPSAIS